MTHIETRPGSHQDATRAPYPIDRAPARTGPGSTVRQRARVAARTDLTTGPVVAGIDAACGTGLGVRRPAHVACAEKRQLLDVRGPGHAGAQVRPGRTPVSRAASEAA